MGHIKLSEKKGQFILWIKFTKKQIRMIISTLLPKSAASGLGYLKRCKSFFLLLSWLRYSKHTLLQGSNITVLIRKTPARQISHFSIELRIESSKLSETLVSRSLYTFWNIAKWFNAIMTVFQKKNLVLNFDFVTYTRYHDQKGCRKNSCGVVRFRIKRRMKKFTFFERQHIYRNNNER